MSWTHVAYRFADEAAWLSALAVEGWASGTPPDIALVVSGTLYEPQADPAAEPVALPGWHVAAAFRDRAPPRAWAALEIDPPAQMPVFSRALPPTLDDYEAAIQAHIDATAGQRGYSSGVSCASYVTDPNPAWSAQAVAFVGWRSAVWTQVYAQLTAVQGGAPPPTLRGLIAALPAMEWPA